MKVLELYAGIGGVAEALRDSGVEVVAVEQSTVAADVYRSLHRHPVERANITTLSADVLAGFEADLWWLSPPCQPFTVRGMRRDLDDRRTESLVHLARLLPQVGPACVVLENVPGFSGSRTEAFLLAMLERARYRVHRTILCPTELGVPNRRRRYYLLASRSAPVMLPLPAAGPAVVLSAYLDAPEDLARYAVSLRTLARYGHAMSVVESNDSAAVATCFTAAYGRSPVRSGSFLLDARGVRRFTEDEILGLLGFSRRPRWPGGLGLEKRYHLVGNAVSVVAARWLLRRVGAGAGCRRNRPDAP